MNQNTFSELDCAWLLREPGTQAPHSDMRITIGADGRIDTVFRYRKDGFDGPVETSGTMVYKNAVVLNRGAAIQIVAAVRDEVTDAIGAATISVKSPE